MVLYRYPATKPFVSDLSYILCGAQALFDVGHTCPTQTLADIALIVQ